MRVRFQKPQSRKAKGKTARKKTKRRRRHGPQESPNLWDSVAHQSERRRQALIKQLKMIHKCLEVSQLNRRDLSEEEFQNLEDRFDQIVQKLTGVSKNLRVLVWLERNTRKFAFNFKMVEKHRIFETDEFLRQVGPGTRLLMIRTLWEMFIDKFPHFAGRYDPNTFITYVGAYTQSVRGGRRHRWAQNLPTKWESFHSLAVKLGLYSRRMNVKTLRREVLRAKAQLVAIDKHP
jgi:hypothetical protein